MLRSTRAQKSGLVAAVAVSTAIILSACSSGSATSAATSPAVTADAVSATSAVAALSAEPNSLNPVLDTTLPSDNLYTEIYDGLTKINGKGKIAPDLATSWTHNADLTSWVYTMRHDATFSDGTNVTAADVVFTYNEATTAAGSKLAAYTTTITSVKATGTYEVTFTLNTPYAPFPTQTASIPILPQAAYTKVGAATFGLKPVGSGPYTVVKWNKGVSVVLTRNDKYFGTKGTVKSLTYEPVPDDTTRANSLQSGSLSVGLLGPAQVAAAKRSSSIKVVTGASNRVLYVGMNQKANKWLADADIRKAIGLAINRAALSKSLLNGSVTPTNQLIAPSVFGYDTALAAPKYDVSQAKKLIKASGYDGSPITLSYPSTGLPQISQLSQAIGSYLTAAGLTVKLDGQEAGTFTASWFAGKLPGAYVFAFAPSTMDADLPYLLLAHSGHQGSFTDPDIDKLMTEEIGEGNATKRKADFAAIAKIIADKSYYAPLFTDSYSYGVAKNLKWVPRPEGFINF